MNLEFYSLTNELKERLTGRYNIIDENGIYFASGREYNYSPLAGDLLCTPGNPLPTDELGIINPSRVRKKFISLQPGSQIPVWERITLETQYRVLVFNSEPGTF